MPSFSERVAQVQKELERLGVNATRKPDEDDHQYINRLVPEAPPETRRMIARKDAQVRIPPCECVECLQQFRTAAEQQIHKKIYTKAISWEDAQDNCNDWVQGISVGREFLRHAISKHGNTIVNRWKKRSVIKRTSLLKEIFPGIAPGKHEILEKNYFEPWHRGREKERNFYMATYHTLDQLTSEPMRLLSLLHARTKHDPEDWVAWDVLQTEPGWLTGKFEVEYCDASVVMSGSAYGKIVKWREHQAHCWTTIGYPRAQLVLESQAFVMEVLRRVVEQVLAGVEAQSLSSKWDELVQTGFRRSRDEETWAVLNNQAYLWPPSFQANDILELCQSRLALAQDELWLLQTDPSYMQHTIAAARNMKLNAQYLKHGDRYEIRVCQSAIMQPVRRVHEWHDVVDECKNLLAMRRIHSDTIRIGLALPIDYENAAGCFELRTVNLLIGRTEELMNVIRESSSFEDHFAYTKGSTPNSLMVTLNTNMKTHEIFRTDPLFWCLIQMTGHPENAEKLDPAVLFAFFDDIVAIYPSETGRVDSQILDKMSDLAALWELLRAVRLQRPLTRSLNIKHALSIRSGGGWEEFRAQSNNAVFNGKEKENIYIRVKALIP